MHENQPCPHLSEFRKLRFGKKSDLLTCVKPASLKQPDPPPLYDCKIFDGAAVVHALPSSPTVSTFDSNAENVFIPFIVNHLHSSKRVDIVWDTYKEKSIKDSTREKRGKGQGRKVTGDTKVLPNWKAFLQDNTNKKELFALLTSRVANCQFPEDKEVNITSDESVVSSRGSIDIQRCDHEETDTRIAVHVLHALSKGCSQVFIRTVDMDVLVIMIGIFHDNIVLYPSAAIWICLGMGKYVQFISVNSICASLGHQTSPALPMFHSFTGCDMTSCFFGKGKKSAWDAWKSFPDVTEAFLVLQGHPYYQLDKDDSIFKLLERFTVVLYDKTSNVFNVNEAHKEIFTKKNRTLENIPPTQDSLLQHVLRAIYQSSIWYTSLQSVQMVPSTEGWGWCDMDSTWTPVWMTLPDSQSLSRAP